MKRTQIKTLNEKFAEYNGKQVKVCGCILQIFRLMF